MGQKVNPIGYRLNVCKTWSSLWFADKNSRAYRSWLHDDMIIRSFIAKKLRSVPIAKVIIKRTSDATSVVIYTSRVALVVGRGGAELGVLSAAICKLVGYRTDVSVAEVVKPDISAPIMALLISQQLEKRVPFKRAIKHFMSLCMRAGAKGVKVRCSGRLGGADIARSEWYMEGRVPLHTLRADIDYGFAEAYTSYGVVGIKTWVYTGDTNRVT